MKKFFVYHGYCSADNCDASNGPTYEISECKSAAEVAGLRSEFEENLPSECSNVIFRVFDGLERTMKPVETVTQWAVD